MGLQPPLRTIVSTVLMLFLVSCATEQEATTPPPQPTSQLTAQPTDQPSELPAANQTERSSEGKASWYGPGFYGQKTASGEVLKEGTMTAAHSSLPMGTRVKVTRLDDDRSVTVVINDRKPFKPGTVIDLAHGSASALDVREDGTALVRIEVID